MPHVHTRTGTPVHAGAAGAAGRGQVANTGLRSFYRDREAVAENAFSMNKTKIHSVRVCVCACARIVPGELQARGWLTGVI